MVWLPFPVMVGLGVFYPHDLLLHGYHYATFLQGLVNVPFWGFVSHHLQTSVEDYLPNRWGDVRCLIGTSTNLWVVETPG